METAATLLQLALTLLIAAQQPNVPEDMKNRAINLANTAISASMEQGLAVPVPETKNEPDLEGLECSRVRILTGYCK